MDQKLKGTSGVSDVSTSHEGCINPHGETTFEVLKSWSSPVTSVFWQMKSMCCPPCQITVHEKCLSFFRLVSFLNIDIWL